MTYQGFSPAISRSICFEANIPENADVKELTQSQLDTLWAGLDKIKTAIREKNYSPVNC